MLRAPPGGKQISPGSPSPRGSPPSTSNQAKVAGGAARPAADGKSRPTAPSKSAAAAANAILPGEWQASPARPSRQPAGKKSPPAKSTAKVKDPPTGQKKPKIAKTAGARSARSPKRDEQPQPQRVAPPRSSGPRPLRPPGAGTSGAPGPGHDLSIVFWKLRDEEQAENKQQDHVEQHAIYGKNSSISVRSVLRFVKKIDPSASPLGIRAVVRAIIEEHCRATRVGPAEANALLREMRITERMFVQTLSTWLAPGRDVDIGPLWNALLRDVDGEDGGGTAAETRRGFTPEVFKAGFEAVGEAISVEEARDLLFGPDDAEIGFGSRTSISKDEFRSLLTGNKNIIVPLPPVTS